MGRLPNEYDWRYSYELGLAHFDMLVARGIGDFGGARSTFAVPGPRQSDSDLLAMKNPGALITERVPGSRSIIGKPIGVVQTFVWELVRPHDCPHHVKHRPGLTPAAHHGWRINRWPRRRKEFWTAIAALATLTTALVALIKFLSS